MLRAAESEIRISLNLHLTQHASKQQGISKAKSSNDHYSPPERRLKKTNIEEVLDFRVDLPSSGMHKPLPVRVDHSSRSAQFNVRTNRIHDLGPLTRSGGDYRVAYAFSPRHSQNVTAYSDLLWADSPRSRDDIALPKVFLRALLFSASKRGRVSNSPPRLARVRPFQGWLPVILNCARCASTGDHRAPSPPRLQTSAQGSGQGTLDCAHRTSTF